MMLFPMKEYLEAIQILHPDIVKFLTMNAYKVERKWRRDMYLFRTEPKYLDIVNYVAYSERVKNVSIDSRIKKTDLLMIFRSDAAISEGAARKIMQEAIDEGGLIEEHEGKIKWISIPRVNQ